MYKIYIYMDEQVFTHTILSMVNILIIHLLNKCFHSSCATEVGMRYRIYDISCKLVSHSVAINYNGYIFLT